MGQKADNPLPEEDDDTKLAKQFSEFFLNQIIKLGNYSTIYHHIEFKRMQFSGLTNSQ